MRDNSGDTTFMLQRDGGMSFEQVGQQLVDAHLGVEDFWNHHPQVSRSQPMREFHNLDGEAVA